MNYAGHRFLILSLIIAVFLLAGCAGSRPVSFYSLNPPAASEDVNRQVASDEIRVIKLGPVEIPEVLDRPQIVFYSGSNEVGFSEFDRWAGSLKGEIFRALLSNLSQHLSGEDITVVSWRHPLDSDYRLDLQVNRFGKTPDGNVVLSARWTLSDGKAERVLYIYESNLTETIKGQGYAEVAAAMSRALERMSIESSEVLMSVIHDLK
jgi:uncharacterized lipoprotein YmbA